MLHRLIFPFLIIGLLVSHQNAAATKPLPIHPGLKTTILEDGLILDWIVPPLQYSQTSNGDTQIEIEGFFQDEQPGALRLPVSGSLIALPEREMPELEILQIETQPLEIPAQLARNEVPHGVLRNASGQVIGGAFAPGTGEPAVESEPIRIESAGIMRGVPLARLIFHPIYATGKSFHVVRQIHIRIAFSASANPESLPVADDPILEAVRSMVMNPQHVSAVKPVAAPIPKVNPAFLLLDGKVAAIEVEFTGLVTVKYADLNAIGFPVGSIDPHNLHLTRGASEVAYQWLGDDDLIFENQERIQFYAEPRFSRWTNADVYTLWQGDSPGLRMESRPAIPTGLPVGTAWAELTAETNAIYTPDCLCAPIPADRDGDRWVWADLKRSPDDKEVRYDFSIQLPSVDPARPASLTVWLIGNTDMDVDTDDHLVRVSVNANVLDEIVWEGKTAASASLPVPAGVLQTGGNTITLTLPGMAGVLYEGAWLDAFSLRYALGTVPGGDSISFSGADTPQAYQISMNSTVGLIGYDVTDPLQPVALTDPAVLGPNLVKVEDPEGEGDHRYWLSTESEVLPPTRLRLLSPLQTGVDFEGVDYLIITPAHFAPALSDLVELRKSQGFQVAMEAIQAIYDIFGDGRPDPAAVQAFLANAYYNWPDRPTHILLVGDGTADPKRYQASSSITYIPPFLADVDLWAGETAADNRYVTLDGEDNLPEMLIGRLPANSLDEVETMVSKIVGYETEPEPDIWSGIATYVADDGDVAGNYPEMLEKLITDIEGNTLTAQRRYFDPDTDTIPEFKDTLKKSWNYGSSLMVYAGHSSILFWAAETFFHVEDVPGLVNGQRLPVLLELTCFTSAFQVPGFETLDETLLRHPTGGVVAAWGSTGLGLSPGHQRLAEGFLEDTFSNPDSDLGRAALEGKLKLINAGSYPDLVDTFTLLGDPATQMFITHSALMPLIKR